MQSALVCLPISRVMVLDLTTGGVLDYKDLRVVNHIVHKSLIKCAKLKGKIEKVETQIV